MGRTIVIADRVIDGTGSSVLEGQAVLVEGDTIQAVAPVGEVAPTESDWVLSYQGATVIPGLINNHVHLVLPGDNTPFVPWIDLQSDAQLALMATHNIQKSLRAGITTVRDCGGRGTIVLDVRDAQRTGMIDGASIVACGWTLTITGGHTRQFGGEVDGEVELRRAVRKVVSKGADYVKVMAAGGGTPGSLPQYPSFTADELRVIVDTAHSLGKLVAAHCIASASIENAIDAGVDMIEHASFYGPDSLPHYDERLAERLAQAEIPVTPTLQVARDLVDLEAAGPDSALWTKRLESQRQVISSLHEIGVPLLAGSDAGWRATDFDTFSKELEELVACGMTPVVAIHAATGAVTASLGLDKMFGTIQHGQRADITIVDGDPSVDISTLRQVRTVIQSGRIAFAPPS